MKNLICMYVILFVSLLVSAAPAAAATQVFLMAGQSNMAGLGGYPGELGYPADLPCPTPYNATQTDVKFWNYGVPQPVGTTNQPSTGDGWVPLECGYGVW